MCSSDLQARGLRDFEDPQLVGLYLAAAVAYLLTMIYAALYGRLADKPAFGFTHTVVDGREVAHRARTTSRGVPPPGRPPCRRRAGLAIGPAGS